MTRWVSATVALLNQEHIISLASLTSPSPLGSGETRAFGLTNFPGWRERLNELNGQIEDLTVEVFYDPLGCIEFDGQVVPLHLEITGFESTGSTLFIRGSAYNPSPHSLSNPGIQADIRTTDGVLQTSNSRILDEEIASDQSISFTLALRLPNGIELPQMEIDVTATAILEVSE
jgi:hypothetical protein